MITSLQNAQNKVLGFMTEIGTSENRLNMISDRYDSSIITYTEMKSNAMDADMAEAIVNLTTAQTVYNAALAGGAEIMRTSLIDFLS
jgi:flagellin-like hook-associated protein FlgL